MPIVAVYRRTDGRRDQIPLPLYDRSTLSDPSLADAVPPSAAIQQKLKPLTLWIARLKHWTGLDRSIAYSVMSRFWSSLAGVVTILLIARFLTRTEQGYYYTFTSIVGLQIVFELGFSFVILQLAAHERANLTFLPDGRVEGNEVSHSRLASVLQKAVRWYSVAGLLMAAVLLPVGLRFFGSQQTAGSGVAWRTPWCLLVIATMLTFQIDPVFSFLEGCGYIAQVAHRRLIQAILGSFLAWTAMATHHGLYSPAMVVSGQVVVGLGVLLFSKFRHLLKSLLLYPVGEHYVGWGREIWPFQWKIAVSWMCGYFMYGMFNPVLFYYQGPIAAGKMGMSLSIATSILSVALSWITTKASPFGRMVARGEIAALDALFFRTLKQSTLMLVACGASFFAVLIFVVQRFPRLATRVLPPWAFGLLLLTMILSHVTICEAQYLRAHKREPFLVQSVMVALLLGCSTVILAKYSGANAVTVGYFIIGGLFGLASGTYIFITKRREWHYSRTSAGAQV